VPDQDATSRKISAKTLAEDIRQGMTDSTLIVKHQISLATLNKFKNQLIENGILSQSDILTKIETKAPKPIVNTAIPTQSNTTPQSQKSSQAKEIKFRDNALSSDDSCIERSIDSLKVDKDNQKQQQYISDLRKAKFWVFATIALLLCSAIFYSVRNSSQQVVQEKVAQADNRRDYGVSTKEKYLKTATNVLSDCRDTAIKLNTLVSTAKGVRLDEQDSRWIYESMNLAAEFQKNTGKYASFFSSTPPTFLQDLHSSMLSLVACEVKMTELYSDGVRERNTDKFDQMNEYLDRCTKLAESFYEELQQNIKKD